MGRPIKKGSTDQSTVIKIIDSTTGLPETAVEHDSPGIDLWWRREQETKTSIAEAALAALDSAHGDGGIEHIGDGYYRLDLPDAAVAAGAGENSVQIGGTVTGMIVIGNEHTLVDYNPYDAASLGVTVLADWVDAGRLDNLLDAIPTTAMRGTDNAALASVLGALNNVAAAGEVTDADTLMQYIKQLINILIGAAGIGAFPAEAAPANAVSLAEVIHAIADDVVGLAGDAMKGTDGANTTVPDAAGTAPTAVEIQTEMEENGASHLDTIVDELANATDGLSALKTLIEARATPAEVNAQVLDVMNVDTYGEPAQGAPPATTTIFTKLNHLYKAWRNKRVTDNSTIEIYNDAGVVVDHKRAHSDDGSDYTKDEMVGGP